MSSSIFACAIVNSPSSLPSYNPIPLTITFAVPAFTLSSYFTSYAVPSSSCSSPFFTITGTVCSFPLYTCPISPIYNSNFEISIPEILVSCDTPSDETSPRFATTLAVTSPALILSNVYSPGSLFSATNLSPT